MTLDKERLLELCEVVTSGTATESGVLELQTLMESDEQARQTFLAWSEMQLDIAGAISDSQARLALDEELSGRSRALRLSQPFGWLLAIAASLVLGLFASSWLSPRGTSPDANQVVISTIPLDGMAVVNRIDNVVWANSQETFLAGDLLKSDTWITLESGVAEIEFGQGAVVVLEGPARFVAKSTSVGLLEFGKLAAVVPPWADGFRVDTPTIEVVDRGTQFVLEVTKDQRVNVAVTKGEVEVNQPTSVSGTPSMKATHRLFAGKAIQTVGHTVSERTFNQQWHVLSKELPARPDHSEVEVITKYRRDFVVGTANEPRREGSWRFYANSLSSLKNHDSYAEMLWDSRRALYDPNGDRGWEAGPRLNAANLSYRGGHPGQGRDQTKDDLDHYVIAAYQVPAEGFYSIKSGWLVRAESREDLENQAVDLRVWVNRGADLIAASCNRDGLLRFQGDLGVLRVGDWINVAVGPQGVSYNDRFEWDFAIVRRFEGPTL